MTAHDIIGASGRLKLVGSLVVISFIGLTLFNGVRSIRQDDARFGWRMFSNQVSYTVRYSWRTPDGTRLGYRTGDELGLAESYVGSGTHGTYYGTGAMRAWLCGYIAYVYRHRGTSLRNATFEARVSHRYNREGEREVEVFAYPLPSGSPCA